jgi:hypothetical protein
MTFARVRGLLIAFGYSYPVATFLGVLLTEAERQPVEVDGDVFMFRWECAIVCKEHRPVRGSVTPCSCELTDACRFRKEAWIELHALCR